MSYQVWIDHGSTYMYMYIPLTPLVLHASTPQCSLHLVSLVTYMYVAVTISELHVYACTTAPFSVNLQSTLCVIASLVT